MKACSVNGCEKQARGKGMCSLHYQRWWKHGDPLFVPLASFRRSVRDRLYANTVTTESGCIVRTKGGGHEFGYTLIQVDGVVRGAHRVSYELEHGPIPDGKSVLHRCDNPPCINPAHLFLGDQLSNMRDMIAKGRKVTHRGERAATKLTTADVEKIRSSSERQSVLAARFSVSPSLISRIKSGDVWAQPIC